MSRSAWTTSIILLATLAPTALAADPATLTLDDTSKALARKFDCSRDTCYGFRISITWEDDGGPSKPILRTDQHYTFGGGAAITWRAPWVDSLLRNVPSFGNEFDNDRTDYAMGITGALTMFTPNDLTTAAPIHTDRPYAGWTYGGVFFQRALRRSPETFSSYESFEFDLGILGPSSLAQNAQEMIHHALRYQPPMGWDNQINDEFEFSIKYNRRWRHELWKQGEGCPSLPCLQILPEAGLTAGSILDEVHAGAMLRAGWNLPDDFGPGSLSISQDFTSPRRPPCASFYIFGRPYGMLVAHNALLQGDNWRHDDPVTANPEPALFGVQYGLTAILLRHIELTYDWTSQSPEFHGQRGWDSWGSFRASLFWTW